MAAEIVMSVNATAPSTPSAGTVSLYPKPDSRYYIKTSAGAELKLLTNEAVVEKITTEIPLRVSTDNTNPVISIDIATEAVKGVISPEDKQKLNAATAQAANNSLVLRDSSGNFSAGTITANLTGRALSCSLIPALTGHVTTNGTTNTTTIAPASINNTMIANTAAIELSKLAVNPLDRSTHTGQQLATTISDLSTAVGAAIGDGNGLVKTGNVLDVVGTANRIAVSANSVDIAANYVGQNSITTLGTIATGTWASTSIGVPFGGTGAATAARASTNLTKLDAISVNTALTPDHQIIIADTSTASFTLTLPAVNTANKLKYVIIKESTDSNVVTLTGDATINGTATRVLSSQYQTLTVISDGVKWLIIN